MIEDFKAISEILEGKIEDVGTEPGVTAPATPQPAQFSFIDAPGQAAVSKAPAETSSANVEDAPQPEQLTLF